MNQPTVLELFAGIGGMGLGLERAGFRVVGQVELDPFCRTVLDTHWPEVPKHDDVRTAVEWWQSRPRPAVDLIAGGFPCQPVSVAGRRRGRDDERWLWPAMAAVVRALRPRYVLVENVPGLLARGMGDVLGDLAALGYDARWDCVPAAALGAPHRRDRVWIVADARYGNFPVGTRSARRKAEQRSPERLESGGTGSEWSLAHADRLGRDGRPRYVGSAGRCESEDGCGVAHSDSPAGTSPGAAVPGARVAAPGPGPAGPGGRRGVVADPDRPRRGSWQGLGRPWPAPVRDGWWTAEPDVGRVAARVPGRVDRLRALGNAVVPQVAEHIGRLIHAALAEDRS